MPEDLPLFEQYGREFEAIADRSYTVRCDGKQLASLIGTAQLACRHPEFDGPTRQITEAFVRDLQKLVAPDPDSALATVLEMGWSEQFDGLGDNDEPRCRGCGCTEDNACLDVYSPSGTCYWVEPDLCSTCYRKQDGV